MEISVDVGQQRQDALVELRNLVGDVPADRSLVDELLAERRPGRHGRPVVTPGQLPPSARDLTDEEWELVELARATIDANTDAGPDEDGVHTMGAAVRALDGRTFVGVNVFHFTGGPCAELVALGAARAGGARGITHIVAVGNHGRGPVGPCGRDRQVLLDQHPAARVILPTDQGVTSVLVTDLMPLAAVWSVDGGTRPYDPAVFEGPPTR